MKQKPHLSAIICEYNPFHYGHQYHIKETRKQGATHIAAIMSGHFVQRGEPALLNKWARAEMALRNGVDLVLELPTPWAMASAEFFAAGGVALANAMGCVDSLSFGSESGNLSGLQAAAQALTLPDTLAMTKTYLKEGMPYAQAHVSAMRHISGEKAAGLLREPNNILAISYLKALTCSQSGIRPLASNGRGQGMTATVPTTALLPLPYYAAAFMRAILIAFPPGCQKVALPYYSGKPCAGRLPHPCSMENEPYSRICAAFLPGI